MTCRRHADDGGQHTDNTRMMSRSNLNPVHCVSENIACADDVWMTCRRHTDDMLLYQPTWYLSENNSNFLKYLIFLASLLILIFSKMAVLV